MKINLIKKQGVLLPATDYDQELLAKIKQGQIVTVELTQKRNYLFHKKFFAMLTVGFEAFEPPELSYRGMPAQKSFERFRKDVIISAGYYDVVSNINGDVRVEAKSISFAAMKEEDFSKLYSNCCNVLLQKVLMNYTKDDLDSVVEELIRF